MLTLLCDKQINLFPHDRRNELPRPIRPQLRLADEETVSDDVARALPKDWNGSGKYNRVGQIGKGAFATVYKVTSKFDGNPYAAKELDKRRFMKNGVLDQKVENEMTIMQKVQHVSAALWSLVGIWTDRPPAEHCPIYRAL